MVSAVFTLGSVQGIWCVVSLSYMSGPAVRRYTFSNQSVSGQPSPPGTANGVNPASMSVLPVVATSSKVLGG